jgi:RND superfamily putative drug exporter
MLSKLANFVVKRHKLIIIAWIIAFICMAPLMGQVYEAVNYEQSETSLSSLESVKGGELISDNFGDVSSTGSTIIVLQADDALSDEVKLAIFDFQTRIQAAHDDGTMDTAVRVDSVYSALAGYTYGYLTQLQANYQLVNASRGDMATSALFVSQMSGASLDLVLTMAALPMGDLSALGSLADQTVARNSLADYPLPVPQALVGALVNSPLNDTMILSLSFLGDPAAGKEYVALVHDMAHESFAAFDVYVTGGDPLTDDMMASTEKDMAIIEPITIILILVLIGLVFRSFVASAIPPMVIGFALGITFGVVYLIATYVMSVESMILTLMLTSMLGAGCDYCIFVLSRYKEERLRGLDKQEAVREAVTWAGESILTSGATVMIGFGVLFLAQLDQMRSIGLLSIGIGVALLVALTLLPSLMMLLGDKLFWPSKMVKKEKKSFGARYFTRTAHFAIRYAKAITLAAVLVSIPAVYMVVTMETSYDFMAGMPQTESVQGMNVLGEGFGEGKIAPTQLLVVLDQPLFQGGVFNIAGLNSVENASASLASNENVMSVKSPTRPMGESAAIAYQDLSVYPLEVAQQYQSMMLGMVGSDARYVLLTVVLANEPYTKSSIDSVSQMRDSMGELSETDPMIAEVYVSGPTAAMYDISTMTQSDMLLIEVLVIIGIYLVLLVVLGSVINPLRSIVTILLSISWTLALTFLVFDMGLGIPISWMVPTILFVMCLGLGLDYDILLTTRIREEVSKGMTTNDAIVHAVEHTGGVITACGIIMAGSFGAMMLSETAMLQQFGFALMFAILVDATVVRMYLVPALMSILGEWNWWAPGPLKRKRKGEHQNPSIVSSELLALDGDKKRNGRR